MSAPVDAVPYAQSCRLRSEALYPLRICSSSTAAHQLQARRQNLVACRMVVEGTRGCSQAAEARGGAWRRAIRGISRLAWTSVSMLAGPLDTLRIQGHGPANNTEIKNCKKPLPRVLSRSQPTPYTLHLWSSKSRGGAGGAHTSTKRWISCKAEVETVLFAMC